MGNEKEESGGDEVPQVVLATEHPNSGEVAATRN
jgi:hypothetical protein